MRPRRLPGWRASGVPGVPGLTPRAMGPGPARKGGDSGSRFTEVFRVDMRPLLHAHGVQRHRGRQTRGDALPHVDRERFTGREPPAVGELGHGVVDDLAVEPRRDLLAQHPIQRSEEHTSELQSPCNLVCRLLLEKKKKKKYKSQSKCTYKEL